MKPRVFVVEDNEPIAALVRAACESQGWGVTIVGAVAGALEAAREAAPDIVLLDVHLPDGSGFEICRRLREGGALAKIPVIFMTVKGDVESRLKGFGAGAQDYVAKPFAVEELMARIRAHLDIKGRIDALTREKEDLALRDRVRQDMIDMVVHDLRAPLGSIRMTLELLHKSGLISNTQYGLVLRNAEDATEFALLMVNDFLDERTGKARVELAPVDVRLVAARIKSLFSPQIAARKLHLRIDLPNDPPRIVSDATLILRIAANFVSNSVKFSQQGETIKLRASFAGGGLRLDVVDSGPGVPDPEKEKIFDKFYRATHDQSRAAPGTGIGLAFCRMAAGQLGGRVSVSDVPDGGSCFSLELPASAPPPKPA
ncbi:MAG: response regulator [Elusimicrobia bacterium]|nr:response regulator [Elusimicrobiota bacterium]